MKIKLEPWAKMPTRAHDTDAGLDLYTPRKFILYSGESVTIDTGVHVELPQGTYGKIASKSGLMTKSGIITDGTVDESYRGSIHVCLFNLGKYSKHFDAGDKIAQMIVIPCRYETTELVTELSATERGENGFGSSGR